MAMKADPNVVPLCDILLVLLIIFMVISPVAQNGMDVTLPEKGENGGCFTPILLTLESDGRILLNSEVIPDEAALKEILSDSFSTRINKTIYIRADRQLFYKDVMRKIDIVKEAGISDICIYN